MSFRGWRKTALPFGHEVRSSALELRWRELGDGRPGDAFGYAGIRSGGERIPFSKAGKERQRMTRLSYMKSEKVEMYLALVRGLLLCVVGDWSCLDTTVDRLDEGVCVCVFFPDIGVSQTSQSSAVSSSSLLTGLPLRRSGWVLSFSPRGVVASIFSSEGLRRAPGDFCAGESTPNSCQNDVAMSAGLESLPVVGSAAFPLPRDDDDDDDRDISPATESRSRLLDFATELRLRTFGGASELDGDMVRDSVPLMPSSPTVA